MKGQTQPAAGRCECQHYSHTVPDGLALGPCAHCREVAEVAVEAIRLIGMDFVDLVNWAGGSLQQRVNLRFPHAPPGLGRGVTVAHENDALYRKCIEQARLDLAALVKADEVMMLASKLAIVERRSRLNVVIDSLQSYISILEEAAEQEAQSGDK